MSASAPCGYRTGIPIAVIAIIVMSAVINVLSLGGALYMLQVYDRVLSSQSIPTLVVLSGILATAYICLGLLDALRAQLMARVAARLDAQLAARAFGTLLHFSTSGSRRRIDNQPLRDLETLRAFLLGAAPHALIDLPWLPLFLFFVVALDPLLGGVTITALVLIALVGRSAQHAVGRLEREAAEALRNRRMLAEAAAGCPELVQSMGLGAALAERRHQRELISSRSVQRAGDRAAWINSCAKILRLSVHSALIGFGAWVALRGELTLGAIVAATIAAGRALAPVEMATAHGQNIVNALAAWRRLRALPAATPQSAPERGNGRDGLVVQGFSHVIPGQPQPVLRSVSLVLKPGEALAVLGKSGAGKSLLSDALVGLISPTVGTVRFEGKPVQWLSGLERRGLIGYAPQCEQWLPGDIADTITGLGSSDARNRAIDTARAAGLHAAICELPHGYQTPIEDALSVFSQGQRRLLALARAFHGTPRFIVLDEPFSDLDADGEVVVNRMIWAARKCGAIVVVTSRRRLAKCAVDRAVIIDGGTLKPASLSSSTDQISANDEKTGDQSTSVITLPRRLS